MGKALPIFLQNRHSIIHTSYCQDSPLTGACWSQLNSSTLNSCELQQWYFLSNQTHGKSPHIHTHTHVLNIIIKHRCGANSMPFKPITCFISSADFSFTISRLRIESSVCKTKHMASGTVTVLWFKWDFRMNGCNYREQNQTRAT